MKNLFPNFLAAACLVLSSAVSAQSSDTGQKQIQLTFAGAGESETVESVLVENMTNGANVTVKGSEILILKEGGSGIETVAGALGDFKPLLYPNPAQGDGNLVFDAAKDGDVTVSIYSMNGTMVDRATVPVVAGRNALNIPSQGYGFYMVYLDGEGYNYVEKWMCGAEKTGSVISHIGTTSVALPREEIKATRAATPTNQYLDFKDGDLLRMTGSAGKMKTIVMRKPEVNHTVIFQMFKCEDLDGYNYPVIEVGGMLWMAEDLRPVKNAKLPIMTSASGWSDPDANPLRMAYADFNSANTQTGAYYTPRAAMKALPEGWELPTADELAAASNALGGADKAGALMKAHGENAGWNTPNYDEDAVQLNLTGNGYLNNKGSFMGAGNAAYVVSRSFKNGIPVVMRLKDAVDAVELNLETIAQAGEGYTVRGVRPAMSPYNGFISDFMSKNPEITAHSIMKGGLAGNPLAETAPLGARYSMPAGPICFVHDNKLMRLKGNTVETVKTLPNVPGLSTNPCRLIGQNMPSGMQRIVRVSWNKESNPADKFNSLAGSSTIKLQVFGHAGEEDFEYSGDIDAGFTFDLPPLNDYAEKQAFKSYALNVIQLECADFNLDGTDDILLGICGKIVIVDGKDYKTVLMQKSFPGNLFIGCATGDINKDGSPDLAVTYREGNQTVLEVWMDGLDKFNGISTLKRSIGDLAAYSGVVIDDINNDDKMDVLAIAPKVDRWVATALTYNKAAKRLEDLFNQDLPSPVEGYVGFPVSDYKPHMVRAEGRNNPPYMIFGFPFKLENGKYVSLGQNGVGFGNQERGEFAVANFEAAENGEDVLLYGAPAIGGILTEGNTYTFTASLRSMRGNKNSYFDFFDFPNYGEELLFPGGERIWFPAIAPIRYDSAIRELELTSIETTMTEPRIYAALAAAPYWQAYADNYVDAPGTSWGYSNAEGQGETKSSTNSAIMIAGYEQEFTMPFVAVKTGGVDFETQIRHDWTESGETSEQIEYAIDYTTFFDDAVVLTFTPYTAYIYTVIKSGDPDELGSTMVIGAPDKPRNMAVTMSDYMKLRADNPAIPNLKSLFRHTPGDPFSYKDSHIDAMPAYGKILWGKGNRHDWQDVGSGTAISRTITVTKEMVTSKETTFNLDATLVGTALGIKVGGGYGRTDTKGMTHTESEGHTVSGTVVGPNSMGDVAAKNFRWNLCRMNVNFGGQQFPVVTYIVEK